MTVRIAVTRLVVVSSLSLLIPLGALAQGETTSAIVGDVQDPTNAAVPHARVTITSQATGLLRETTTDDSGRFNFPQLKPGVYSVKVEAPGFESQQNDAVQAALGQKQTIDFSLKLSQSSATIEVNG